MQQGPISKSLRLKLSLLAAVVLAATTIQGPLWADEIPVVNVTSAGPDRDVPMRSFYLAGKATAKTKSVRALLVRTKTPWLFSIDSGPSCEDLQKELNKRFKRPNPPAAGLDSFPSGSIRMSELLPSGNVDKVWLSPSWKRDEVATEAEPPFKIYVGPDDTFFLPGARYCVFVYKEETRSDVKRPAIAEVLESLDMTLESCEPKESPEAEKCETSALDEFDTGLKRAIAEDGLDNKSAVKLEQAARSAWTQYRAAAQHKRVVRGILDAWLAPGDRAGVLKAPSLVQDFELRTYAKGAPQNEREALDRAVTQLLLRAGGKLFERQNGGKHEYWVTRAVPKGGKTAVVVTRGSFTTNFEDIEVITSEGEHLSLKLGADDLKLEPTDLTLLDLLELSRNRVRFDKGFLSIRDLRLKLLAAQNPTKDKEAAEHQLATLGRYVNDALEQQPRTPTSPAPVQAPAPNGVAPVGTVGKSTPAASAEVASPGPDIMLGQWVRSFLVECKAKTPGWPGQDACVSKSDHRRAPWPGYHKGYSDGPLVDLADALRFWVSNQQVWEKLREEFNVTITKAESVPFMTPIGARFAYSQENWFFSYVTPVIGYAGVDNGSEEFPIGYLAAQVHLVPNPVDSPLWTRGGRDWARLFALELGASLPAKEYGPGDRFTGWKSLPPVFIGVVAHVLPYAGVSVGGVLLERRSTSVEGERATTIFPLYVGLNVQANVPDIVRSLSSKTTTTTTE